MGEPPPPPNVHLRAVERGDLPIFFEYQLEPDATRMAAFPARDEPTFYAHWNKILRDESALQRTIMLDHQVVGNIGSWGELTNRNVGYWIGKQYWNRGIATRALAEYLTVEDTRPLYAHVVKHNAASLRVLQKCGFTITPHDDVHEFILELLR